MPSFDKEPQKKRPRKSLGKNNKKVNIKTVGLSGIPPEADILPITSDIDEVIKQAFMRFYDGAKIKQSKLKDLEHLSTICEEYLKAYVILGYDLNGEKVHIMHASNHHDKDALVEHIRSTLINMVNNGQN